MKYIIKPFSEIIVKSKPVRKRYLNCLQTNCSLALKKVDEFLKVKVFWDKLEVEGRMSEDDVGRCQKILKYEEVKKEEIIKIL
ncbi:MAG: hypothetical protein LBD88_02295 [Candidatus Peribacteria bacterium]|jgi:adenylyl- and sulfurtransferase ThiI|nr:hypothetical protein [Candidatus Peribacteria bacterium]